MSWSVPEELPFFPSLSLIHIYQEVAKFLGTELEETYVFEDVLYAIETAKKAGFHTVGIYDQYSARDTEKIKQEAEFYLESMEHASEILENL